MYRMWMILLTVCVGLFGCSTKYGSSGLTGGYSQQRVNDRLIKVNFFGNGFIASDRVQMFALYRCAEVAREAGKPYFVVYDSLLAAARNLPSKQPLVGTLGNKPAAYAFIKLEDKPEPGSHEVSAVLAELAPLVQETSTPAKVK